MEKLAPFPRLGHFARADLFVKTFVPINAEESAAFIIARATPTEPADRILRQTLASVKDPHFRLEVSRGVFAYYRWLGWLDPKIAVERAVVQALDLDWKFQQQPAAFDDAELLAKSVPAWAPAALDVSPAWARALQRHPTLWLRARQRDAAEIQRVLVGSKSGPFPGSLEYAGEIDLFRTPEFHQGRFEVQDISSQAVGFLCGPRPGETWWDACAGEGGKLLHLSELMQNKGLIWASDRADWRLKNLKRRTGRAGVFNYRAAPWDGSQKLPTKTKFDGILIDAPCSGAGTWQRNPHARWTTQPADVSELAALQKTLLRHAANSLKPGGRLIYSVCTLTRAETVEVAANFQSNFPDFKPIDLTDPWNPGPTGSTGLFLRPEETRGNGMFVAGWTR